MKIIFVVDDNNTNLLAAKFALEDSYKIYALPSAAGMFKLIENITPDLILLDVDMPEMDGFEAIKILKANDKFKDIPVIFLTIKNDEMSELEGFDLGAVDYIMKPFSKPVIKARIATHLKTVEYIRIVEKLSLIDELTNLPNRRFFDSELLKHWKHAIRDSEFISLLMIDIDHFKVLNDTYGHSQGDEALKTLAHVINSSVRRAHDFVARWGGEEFCVIMPNTNPSGAFAVAEIIRKNVEKSAIINIDDPTKRLSITISVGGNSALPNADMVLSEFFNQTDSALYEAKKRGRNNTFILS